MWNGCIISRRPLDNAAVCSLPRQGSSPWGALVGGSFNQSQINYFVDTKSLLSINWWLQIWGRPQRRAAAGHINRDFTESIGLRASNEDHQRKTPRERERERQRKRPCHKSWVRHHFILYGLIPQETCTFNGSRSVRSTEPSPVLYLQSLSLWSMVE